MDDLNEMARLHSAGATVRNSSPFSDLPAHANEMPLTEAFLKKWVAPFYMEIGSNNDQKWIGEIEKIKDEISVDTCLSLLGDFNWRTRLVGAYFVAVKGYEDLVDIIGVHLLKSEVCCVGRIYALTLAFFKTDESVSFLNKYLDYYLTTPDLFFDQKSVMEAILYLDKANGTNGFEKYLKSWRILEQKRIPMKMQTLLGIADMVEMHRGKSVADEFRRSLSANSDEKVENFTTEYFDEQISILRDLSQYNSR